MLNHTRISMAMQKYSDRAFAFMRRKGYILPTLLAFKEGAPLKIELDHPQILEVVNQHDDLDEILVGSGDIISETGIAFRLNRDYRDTQMASVAKQIAKEYSPDAIGVISACLFKNFTPEEAVARKVGDLQKDPEAMRVVYVSYYLNGDKEPTYMDIPYILNDREHDAFDSNDNGYEVSMFPCSWKHGEDETDHILPYPFA